MKIKNIIDQYSDKGQYLLAKLMGTDSDMLKLAANLEDVSKLASDKFAWAEFRKFPVNSQDNTILSKMYFDNQKCNIPEVYHTKVAAKLDTYLDLYDVPEELFKTTAANTVLDKVASCEWYLLPEINMCKVASCSDLDKANDIFNTDYKKLEIKDRVEFSKNFMKCASALKYKGVPKQQIIKYAAMLDTDMTEVKNMLAIRVAAANRIGKKGFEYSKLAEMLDVPDLEVTTDDLEKLAETILSIDEQHGFTGTKYDSVMPCAYGVVFNKEAFDSSKDTVGGAVELKKSDIVGQYGHGILEEVENEDGSINKDRLDMITKKLNIVNKPS